MVDFYNVLRDFSSYSLWDAGVNTDRYGFIDSDMDSAQEYMYFNTPPSAHYYVHSDKRLKTYSVYDCAKFFPSCSFSAPVSLDFLRRLSLVGNLLFYLH